MLDQWTIIHHVWHGGRLGEGNYFPVKRCILPIIQLNKKVLLLKQICQAWFVIMINSCIITFIPVHHVSYDPAHSIIKLSLQYFTQSVRPTLPFFALDEMFNLTLITNCCQNILSDIME